MSVEAKQRELNYRCTAISNITPIIALLKITLMYKWLGIIIAVVFNWAA
jgi:hypothetical protein